jgi:hypothetical protein
VLATDVQKILAPSTPFPAWVEAYNNKVTQPDKKRMIGVFGRDVVVVLPPAEEEVKGVKRVVIKDGMVVPEYPKDALDKGLKIWSGYKLRGKEFGR